MATPIALVHSLASRTFGVVGFGRARSCAACSRFAPACSSSILLSPPSLPQTKQMFNAATFAKMKVGAVFINVTRGDLADSDALLAALESGHLGSAALDLFDPEPIPPGIRFGNCRTSSLPRTSRGPARRRSRNSAPPPPNSRSKPCAASRSPTSSTHERAPSRASRSRGAPPQSRVARAPARLRHLYRRVSRPRECRLRQTSHGGRPQVFRARFRTRHRRVFHRLSAARDPRRAARRAVERAEMVRADSSHLGLHLGAHRVRANADAVLQSALFSRQAR